MSSPTRVGNSTTFEGRAGRTHGPQNPLEYSSGPEYRDAAELRSIAGQLAGIELRLGHDGPRVGQVTAGRVEGDHAVATLRVDDARGLAAIMGGVHELSLGYNCRLDGQRYQRGIVLDHLAIVPAARCGPTCSIKTDCDGGCGCKLGATDGKLTAQQRHNLPAGSFAVPGAEDLPIENESHVRAAMSRFGQEHFPSPDAKRAAYHRILAAARKFGVESTGFEKAHASNFDASSCAPANAVQPSHHIIMDNDNLTKVAQDAIAAQLAAERARDTEKARADAEKARADAAEGTAAALRKQLEAAEAARGDAAATQKLEQKITQLEQLVAAEKARADEGWSTDRLAKAVKGRVEIERSAAMVLPEIPLAKYDDRQLMEVVIDKLGQKDSIAPGADGKARSDEYVGAVFSTAMTRFRGSATALERLRETVAEPVTSQHRIDSRSAREKMLERNRNAWKQPAPAGGKVA